MGATESKNWAIKVEPKLIVYKALEMSEQWKTDLATIKRTQNKYPQSIMGVLAQAKNGDEQFWNRNFMQPMRSALFFFFNKFFLGGDFFLFPFLPSGSQYVP